MCFKALFDILNNFPNSSFITSFYLFIPRSFKVVKKVISTGSTIVWQRRNGYVSKTPF